MTVPDVPRNELWRLKWSEKSSMEKWRRPVMGTVSHIARPGSLRGMGAGYWGGYGTEWDNIAAIPNGIHVQQSK